MSDIVNYTPTNKAWLFGTREGYATLRDHLIDDGQWHSYTYTFQWQQTEIDATDNRIHITMEDWESAGGSYGDVFFDNVSFVEIPEPMSAVLLGLGGVLLRKKMIFDRRGW